MTRYKCLMCGYVYDPAVGDPHAGVAAGTPFEELPDEWVCPECGVGKDEFKPWLGLRSPGSVPPGHYGSSDN